MPCTALQPLSKPGRPQNYKSIIALVDCNSRIECEGRVGGVRGKAQSAAIAMPIASICNAAAGVAYVTGTLDLVFTVHSIWRRMGPVQGLVRNQPDDVLRRGCQRVGIP